jgi:ribosomal protein S5
MRHFLGRHRTASVWLIAAAQGAGVLALNVVLRAIVL